MHPELFGRATQMVVEMDKQTEGGIVAAAKLGCAAMHFVQKELRLPDRLAEALHSDEVLEAVAAICADLREYESFLRSERTVLQVAHVSPRLAAFVIDTAIKDAEAIRGNLSRIHSDKRELESAADELRKAVDRIERDACATAETIEKIVADREAKRKIRKHLWDVAEALAYATLAAANGIAGTAIAQPYLFLSAVVAGVGPAWFRKD